jgi:hypothetical protein
MEVKRYKEFPYALLDNTSRVTIGYGYDLGQQSSSIIQRELT